MEERNMEMKKYSHYDSRVVWEVIVDELNEGELEKLEIIDSYDGSRTPYKIFIIRKTYKKGSLGEKYGANTIYKFETDYDLAMYAVCDALSYLDRVEKEITLKVKIDKKQISEKPHKFLCCTTYSLEVK